MLKIEPPDCHYLLAASGWIDLGNHQEATAELNRIRPPLFLHPDVLKVRWNVYAMAKEWQGALNVAILLQSLDPDDPFGWIHSAYALHELKKTKEALETLLPLEIRFPDCETIPYNLACYTAQLGDLDRARIWLEKAMEVGERTEIKARALTDPDLAPLRKQIKSL